MHNYVYDITIDDFFYRQNINFIPNYDGTFSLRPFTKEDYPLLDWFVSTMKHDIPTRIDPVKILDNIPLPEGYWLLTKDAVYRNSDFDVLVAALPFIRALYDKEATHGNFQEDII